MSVVQLSPAAAPMTAAEPSATKATTEPVPKIGMRVNGKNWHAPKKPFRPTAGQTSFAKRKELETLKQATKAREQEMREEKVAERNRRIQAIKDRRKAKEEKERYEKMAEKMHKKVVERRKRREKRNKLLKS
ncbi:rRNA-processing protein cgrA [Fonsecaea erecta]|uniref:rRNA-processing protein n=1 Tax=Fonsecaea erecta TaxID=1367422 RepID=A0A178ZWA2_9EURO|nr:rRNA-processing protein cgrA [Fonsecaea erecta]OAP63533.1 rRNA-processing protein cgrA [Fonsecaea erecta]